MVFLSSSRKSYKAAILWERRGSWPLLDPSLLRVPCLASQRWPSGKIREDVRRYLGNQRWAWRAHWNTIRGRWDSAAVHSYSPESRSRLDAIQESSDPVYERWPAGSRNSAAPESGWGNLLHHVRNPKHHKRIIDETDDCFFSSEKWKEPSRKWLNFF